MFRFNVRQYNYKCQCQVNNHIQFIEIYLLKFYILCQYLIHHILQRLIQIYQQHHVIALQKACNIYFGLKDMIIELSMTVYQTLQSTLNINKKNLSEISSQLLSKHVQCYLQSFYYQSAVDKQIIPNSRLKFIIENISNIEHPQTVVIIGSNIKVNKAGLAMQFNVLSIFRCFVVIFKYMDFMSNQQDGLNSNSDDFHDVLESCNAGSFPEISENSLQLDPQQGDQSIGQPYEEKQLVETIQDVPVSCQIRKCQQSDIGDQKPENIQPRNDSLENQSQFRKILKQDHRQGKNSNFTKLIIRLFNSEIEALNRTGQMTKLYYKDFIEARKIYEEHGKRNIQIRALQILFGSQKNNSKFTKANRSILIQMLNDAKFIDQQILYSPFIKEHNKKQHLLAAKIYKLRCRSRLLMGRTQTK